MGEYKRKFGFYAAWNYELELDDLNEMSAKGWQLINGGLFSNKFKKNTEIQYRYQLDYHPNIEDKGRYIETFREQGWEYISSTFNGWHYFRKLYDVNKPEEEYEIFTDASSVKEMNNRWVVIGIICSAIMILYLILHLYMMVVQPKITTLSRMIYLAGIFAVILRGIWVMKKQGTSRKSRFDRILMLLMITWTFLGSVFIVNVAEARPYCSWSNRSEEFGPIAADLNEATNWIPIEIKYADNYYLDLKIDASKPICVSFVDEDRNVIYSVKEAEFEEENIRMRLDKGKYSIYLSDFEGGSISLDMSFE